MVLIWDQFYEGDRFQLTHLLTETERRTVIMTKSRNLIDPRAPPQILDQAIIPFEAQQKSKPSTNTAIVSIFKTPANVDEVNVIISTNAVNAIAFHMDTIHVMNKYFHSSICMIVKIP